MRAEEDWSSRKESRARRDSEEAAPCSRSQPSAECRSSLHLRLRRRWMEEGESSSIRSIPAQMEAGGSVGLPDIGEEEGEGSRSAGRVCRRRRTLCREYHRPSPQPSTRRQPEMRRPTKRKEGREGGGGGGGGAEAEESLGRSFSP